MLVREDQDKLYVVLKVCTEPELLLRLFFSLKTHLRQCYNLPVEAVFVVEN